MSSATKSGLKAYMKAWNQSALSAGVFYAISVLSIIWYLSIKPTLSAVELSGPAKCIDSLIPTSFGTLAKFELVFELAKQAWQRFKNRAGRTIIDSELTESLSMDNAKFEKETDEQKNLSARNLVLSEAARKNTENRAYENCRTNFLRKSENLGLCEQLANEEGASLDEYADLVNECGSNVDAKKAKDAKNANEATESGAAPLPPPPQQTGGQKEDVAVGSDVESETEKSIRQVGLMEGIVKGVLDLIGNLKNLFGCYSDWKRKSVSKWMNDIDMIKERIMEAIKPTLLINQDHLQSSSGQYQDKLDDTQVERTYFTIPLQAPYQSEKDNQQKSALMSLIFAVVRPFVYIIFGLISAALLAYDILKVPYTQLMNSIYEWIADGDKSGNGLDIVFDSIKILTLQGFLTFLAAIFIGPLFAIAASIIFIVAMLYVAGPFSLITLFTEGDKPMSKLYYALIAGAVPALLILGGQSRSLLSKLASHSDLKAPLEAVWWILAALALLTGTIALNQDSQGKNPIGARIIACLSLIGMAAVPPIAVAVAG